MIIALLSVVIWSFIKHLLSASLRLIRFVIFLYIRILDFLSSKVAKIVITVYIYLYIVMHIFFLFAIHMSYEI